MKKTGIFLVLLLLPTLMSSQEEGFFNISFKKKLLEYMAERGSYPLDIKDKSTEYPNSIITYLLVGEKNDEPLKDYYYGIYSFVVFSVPTSAHVFIKTGNEYTILRMNDLFDQIEFTVILEELLSYFSSNPDANML